MTPKVLKNKNKGARSYCSPNSGSSNEFAVLLKRPLKLPSDLDGIVYEPFDNVRDIKSTIKDKLETWGLVAPN